MINGAARNIYKFAMHPTGMGYFTDLIAGTVQVFTNNVKWLNSNGILEGVPVYVQYSYGLGQVFLNAMPLEYPDPMMQRGSDFETYQCTSSIISNELSMAKDFHPAPVPIPGVFYLVGAGLGRLVLYRRRKLTANN